MSKKLLYIVGILLIVAMGVWLSKDKFQPLVQKDTPQSVTYPLPQTRNYEKPIALPKPRTSGGIAVEKAIQERRSRREFSEKPVTLAELSQVLWAGQGITDPKTEHRSAPSAREAYPFTIFVVVRNVAGLQPGLYEYLPKAHALGDLQKPTAGEMLNSAAVQPGARNAPVVFLLAAAYGTAQKTLGESAVESSLLEAGHIGQNMYLQSESLGMAMVVMGGFDPVKVGTAVMLDPAETIVYVIPFGNRAAETSATVKGESVDTEHVFTTEELAKYNGKNGNKAYVAYEGKVYDFSSSEQWKDGEHYGLSAGQDLTGKLGEAPHGSEVVNGYPVVGTYGAATTTKAEASAPTAPDNTMMYVLGGVGLVLLIGIIAFLSRAKKTK